MAVFSRIHNVPLVIVYRSLGSLTAQLFILDLRIKTEIKTVNIFII